MKKLILIYFILGSLMLPRILYAQAFKDQETGAGNVVRVEGEYHLFDLHDAGIKTRKIPIIEDQMGASLKITEVFNRRFLEDPEFFNSMVYMLNYIYLKSPQISYEILDAWKQYSWNFVDSDIDDIRDIRNPIRSFHEARMKTVAFRNDVEKYIFIEEPLYKKMPTFHKVALFFHEAFYILSHNRNSSDSARYFTAIIFSDDFKTQNTSGEFIRDYQKLTQRNLTLDKKIFLVKKQWDYLKTDDYKKECEKEKKHLRELSMKFSDLYLHYENEILKTNIETEKPLQAFNPSGGVIEYNVFKSKMPEVFTFFDLRDHKELQDTSGGGINTSDYGHEVKVPETPEFKIYPRLFYEDATNKKQCLDFDETFTNFFYQIRKEALELLNSESRKKLWGQCYSELDFKALHNLATIKVVRPLNLGQTSSKTCKTSSPYFSRTSFIRESDLPNTKKRGINHGN